MDEPRGGVADADRLAQDVMEARGYFTEGRQRAYGENSGPADNYRRAHRISQANDRGRAGTRELRQALVYYRSLFEELIESDEAMLTRT